MPKITRTFTPCDIMVAGLIAERGPLPLSYLVTKIAMDPPEGLAEISEYRARRTTAEYLVPRALLFLVALGLVVPYERPDDDGEAYWFQGPDGFLDDFLEAANRNRAAARQSGSTAIPGTFEVEIPELT